MSFELTAHPSFDAVDGPVLLVVMDGVGIGDADRGDAVHLARTPTLERLAQHAFGTTLKAHGVAVGLPSDDDMGNSEVGHNAIGAGRVFDQGAKRVELAVQSGELFEGEVWKSLVARVIDSGEPMHFIGLLSDGNVHSHQDHLFAMLRRLVVEGVKSARVHILLDGRDVPQTSALEYLDALENVMDEVRAAGLDVAIASGGGRMLTTMDRYEADWSIVERGWNAHVHGVAEHRFESARDAIITLRAGGEVIDQFLPAFVIQHEGAPVGRIRDGASVIFFNFRGDRAIEITRAFTEADLATFDRGARPDVLFAGMMQYDGDLRLPEKFLVDPPKIERTLGEFLARNEVTQFACSETQKYGHVTYFWNGNRSGRFSNDHETYVEIPSDNVPFEQRPWMKAAEVTDATLEAIQSGAYRHLRINLANGDMVGHTGKLEASIIAVECVDLQLQRLMEAIEDVHGALIVTADHGNADQMIEKDKKTGALKTDAQGNDAPRTSHSLNPVPCFVYAPGRTLVSAKIGDPGLVNLAATVLQLLGFAAPEGFEPSLIA